jgi:hypothetical protein
MPHTTKFFRLLSAFIAASHFRANRASTQPNGKYHKEKAAAFPGSFTANNSSIR